MYRLGVVIVVAAACAGSSGRRTNEVPADLDLDPDAGVADAAPPAMRDVHVEVVAEAPQPDGVRIDVAVRDADVTDVLRMIAAVAKVGLVVSDDVRATVTLELHDVTWRQAIDVIAHLAGLEISERDGIVSVSRAR